MRKNKSNRENGEDREACVGIKRCVELWHICEGWDRVCEREVVTRTRGGHWTLMGIGETVSRLGFILKPTGNPEGFGGGKRKDVFCPLQRLFWLHVDNGAKGSKKRERKIRQNTFANLKKNLTVT